MVKNLTLSLTLIAVASCLGVLKHRPELCEKADLLPIRVRISIRDMAGVIVGIDVRSRARVRVSVRVGIGRVGVRV